MSEFTEALKTTLDTMERECRAPMGLWAGHKNAALNVVHENETLTKEIERLRATLDRVRRGNGYEYTLPEDVAALVHEALL